MSLRVDNSTSSDNKPYFILKGINGEIIGTSEMYESEQGREVAIAAVKDDAPIALIEVEDDRTTGTGPKEC